MRLVTGTSRRDWSLRVSLTIATKVQEAGGTDSGEDIQHGSDHSLGSDDNFKFIKCLTEQLNSESTIVDTP